MKSKKPFDHYKEHICKVWFDEKGYQTATEIVSDLIRCKDCKFATITDGVYGRNPEVKYCDIWFPSEAEYMPINYYCASAERKEEKKK